MIQSDYDHFLENSEKNTFSFLGHTSFEIGAKFEPKKEESGKDVVTFPSCTNLMGRRL